MPTLPFIQPSSAEVPYLAPDMSFLQGHLDRANQRYEEGLQEIKSDFSAVLNADITNDENKTKRAEYIKQLNEGLKGIAGQDVSDPKVMRKAEGLVAPFWQDNDLLQDINLTKRAKTEIQRGLSASMSKDDEIRNSFDEASLKPIYHSLKKLKGAKRGSGEFNSIEVPNWTPFVNVGNYMSEFKENEKPEVNWDEINGEYIITHKNGADSVPAYITMINGKLDQRFTPQFQIYGKNYVNEKVDAYMNANPGTTEADARNALAKEVLPGMTTAKKLMYDNYDVSYNQISRQLKTFEDITQKGGKLTDKQLTQQSLYKMKLEGIDPLRKKYKMAYEDMLKPETAKNLAFNLETFYGEQIRQETVQNYAESFAADQGESIKENTAHFAAANLNLATQKLKDEKDWRQYQMIKDAGDRKFEMFKLGIEHPEAMDALNQNATGLPPGSRPSAKATELAVTVTEHDIYTNEVNDMKQKITSSLFWGNDTYGGVSELLKNIGVTPEELDIFNKYQAANQLGTLKYNKEGKFIPSSVKEGQLYESVLNKLRKETGAKGLTTPDAVTGALIDYAMSWVKDNKKNMTNTDALAYYTDLINNADKQYKTFKNLEHTRSEMMKQKLKDDPSAYSNISVERKPGEYDVVNDNDIKNKLEETGLKDITVRSSDGKVMKLNTEDIAKAYTKGNFKIGTGIFEYNGEPLSILEINGSTKATNVHDDFNVPKDFNEHWYRLESERGVIATQTLMLKHFDPIYKKYGTSEQLKDNINNFAVNTVPNVEYYRKRRGEVPTTVTVPISDKFEKNLRYVQDLVKQGNIGSIVDNSGQSIALSDREALRNLINNNPKALGSNIEYFYSSPVYGSRKLAITIQGGEDVNNIPKSLNGKTFYIDVAPTTISPLLKNLPVDKEEKYDPIYTPGYVENESPADRALGYTYSLRYQPETNRFVIDGNFHTTNPDTGADIDQPFSKRRSADDGGAVGAAQLVNEMRNQYVQQDINNQKRYKNK
jgi:hypothetical protein